MKRALRLGASLPEEVGKDRPPPVPTSPPPKPLGLFASVLLNVADVVEALLPEAPVAKRRDSMDGPLDEASGLGPLSVLSLGLLGLSALWVVLGHVALLATWLSTLRTEYGRELLIWFVLRSPGPWCALVVCCLLCRAHIWFAVVDGVREYSGFAVDLDVTSVSADLLGARVEARDVTFRDASRPETLLSCRSCVLDVGVDRCERTGRLVASFRFHVTGATVLHVAYDDSDGDSSLRRAVARLARGGRSRGPPASLLPLLAPLRVLGAANRLVATVSFVDGVVRVEALRARTRRDVARPVANHRAARLPRRLDCRSARGLHVFHAIVARAIVDGVPSTAVTAPTSATKAVASAVLHAVRGNAEAELAHVYEAIKAIDDQTSPRSRAAASAWAWDDASGDDSDLDSTQDGSPRKATPAKRPSPAPRTPAAIRFWNAATRVFVGGGRRDLRVSGPGGDGIAPIDLRGPATPRA